MNVLYVEDNPLDADLTRREFARHAPDIELETVPTKAAALAKLEQPDRYDLVLTDLRLPDGDGLSILVHIREQKLPLAVVIITGAGDEKTVVAALKAGANDYVTKRQDYLTHLPQLLENALARFQAEELRKANTLRVLYVERNAIDIDLTRRHLARHAPHIKLEAVFSAPEALTRLPTSPEEPSPYNILLLDYNLPSLNALELLKTLYIERRLSLPAVLVTGQGDEEAAAQALRLGAADYLVKHSGYLYELTTVLENVHYRTQLDRERAALKSSLREKELLLQELYHRTRNNMQVIISMLRLQAASIKDEQARKLLNRTQQRIQSMALVHEKLYQSKDLSRINLAEYIVNLTQLFTRTHHLPTNRIKWVFNMEPVTTLIDIALPCGLILNELVSNALEHAFPNEQSGEIKIALHRTGPGELRLEVSDNGAGVPEDFDFWNSDGYGLQTIIIIAENQLEGKIAFESSQGLTCRIQFRDDLYHERV